MSKNKIIYFHEEARNKMLQGIKLAGKVAKVTLGPGGLEIRKSEQYGPGFRATKDGFTGLRDLELKDPGEQAGVSMVLSVTSDINNNVGDGTTTASVLTSGMIEAVERSISDHSNIKWVCSGLEWARDRAFETLRGCKVAVTDSQSIKHVATVAANGDERVGEIIATVHEKIGNGSIDVSVSNSTDTSYEIVDGFEIDKGYISSYFLTDFKREVCELDKPFVLVTEEKISSVEPIVPILQHVSSTGSSLIIIADDVEGEALTTIVLNKLRAGLKVCAIKAPEFGQRKSAILQDIATLTGARVIAQNVGLTLKDAQECLGRASSVKVFKDRASIINADVDKTAINARCEEIQGEIDRTQSSYDQKHLQTRFDKLKYGAAVIRVGGNNEESMKAHKDLVEDAVLAVKAAVEEGIVPGGGATYACIAAQITKELQEIRHTKSECWTSGAKAFVSALQTIESTILENALQSHDEVSQVKNQLQSKRTQSISVAKNSKAADGGVILEAINAENIRFVRCGYDARAQEYQDDMLAEGIIDTAKGAFYCIQKSTAMTISFLTTGALILDMPEKEDSNPGTPGLEM